MFTTTGSYSKLSQYEKCPYTLVLRQTYPAQSNEYAKRGIQIHKDFENFLNKTGPIPNFPYFHWSINDVVEHEYYAERPFGVDMFWRPDPIFGNAYFKSIMDVIYFKPNEINIIDFKTGKSNPITHTDQSNIYAIITNIWFPTFDTINTHFWYLDHDRILTHIYPKNSLPPMLHVLQKRVDKMINDAECLPRPQKYKCKFCNYREHCDYKV